MKEFQFELPTRIVFGEGKFEKIGEITKEFGKKAFLVIDPSLKKVLSQRTTNILEKVNIPSIEFNDIQPNPPYTKIDEASVIAKKEKCDLIIGIGGGSAIDTAKAVAVVLGGGGSAWDYVQRTDHEVKKPAKATPPIIAVPTTAGTGSETTLYSVLTNPIIKEKSTIISPIIFPKIALVDPELTISMPPFLTASTGFDAFAHAVEAYISVNSNPLSDIFALEAIKLLSKYLPGVVANGRDIVARGEVAFGATLAGVAISHGGTTLPHAIGQAVGGYYNAPHGGTIAASYVAIMEYSFISNQTKFAKIAEIMDPSVATLPLRTKAEKAVVLIEQFLKDINLNVKFSDYGVKKEDVPKLVESVLKGYKQDVEAHPRVANKEEIANIYYKCL